jgi:hypothetical protein
MVATDMFLMSPWKNDLPIGYANKAVYQMPR